MELLLPGDLSGTSSSEHPVIGFGIEKRGEQFYIAQPGLLKKNGKKQWVSVQAKRYVPEKGDLVVGIVMGKIGESFKVDIGSTDMAVLSFLAFEGATKRNRPLVKTGDLVYARIVSSSKHLEPELSCIDSESRARGMGVLPSGGSFLRVPLHIARRLLSPSSQLLFLLGEHFKFEITVGLNGRIWINSGNDRSDVFIRNIVSKSEYVSEADIPHFVHRQVLRIKTVC